MAVRKPKNCRDVFCLASQSEELTKAQRKKCERICDAMARNKRFARAAQERMLAAYEEENGEIVGAVNWQAILDWFIANGPAIIKFIMSIMALFAV